MHVTAAIEAFEETLGQSVVALKTEGHKTWNIDIVFYKLTIIDIIIIMVLFLS